MHPFKFALFLAVCLSVQAIGKASVAAEDTVECLVEIAAADLAAKRAHQENLRDLIVSQRPEFTALADINRDVQILFAETRFARLEHLLATAPERLDSANGLSSFRNFDWGDEDLKDLLAANPSYRAQLERLEALKAQNNGHPDWPAMREFVRQGFAKEGPFKDLITVFLEHNAVLEETLSDCRPD